jgi:hypothetical protein
MLYLISLHQLKTASRYLIMSLHIPLILKIHNYLGAQRRIGYSILTRMGFGRNGLSRGKSYEKVEMGEALDHLYNSKKILENFISALTEAARQNKEKLAELDLARSFVKVLAEDGERKRKK